MTIVSGPLTNLVRRLAVTTVYKLQCAFWFVTRPEVHGSHAIALTPDDRIILVKQSYRKGWYLPGGARELNESPAECVMRELREEVGGFSDITPQLLFRDVTRSDFRKDFCTIFLVRDCLWEPPGFTLEIEDIAEFNLEDLPQDLCPRARSWIRRGMRDYADKTFR